MSNTNDKAEEVINRKHGISSQQHWGHSSVNDEEELGAHWNSCSRRSRPNTYNSQHEEDREKRPETKQYQESRKQGNRSATGTEGKSRSKNRRPDVAVYVPRARRTQQSSNNEVSEENIGADINRVDSDKRSRTDKNKGGFEVYVPKPRRLQQSEQTEGTEHCDDHSKQDKTGSTSFRPKKLKKHVHKEHASHAENCDISSDRKSHSDSKHKHKSKRSARERKPIEGETKEDRNDQEMNDVIKSKDGEASLDTVESADIIQTAETEIDGAFVDDETWDDEMKFYDSVNQVEEGNIKSDIAAIDSQDCTDNSGWDERQLENQSPPTAPQVVPMKEDKVQEVQEENHLTEKCGEGETAQNDNILCSENHPVPNSGEDDSLEKPSKQRRTSEEDTSYSENKQECAQVVNESGNDQTEHYSLKVSESGDHEQSNDAKEQLNVQTEDTSNSIITERTDIVENIGDAITGENSDGNSALRVKCNTEETATPESMNCGAQITEDIVKNDNTPTTMETEDDGDTWDSLFADDGEALDPKLMDELTAAVGKVTVQKTQFDYYNYQPKDPDLDDISYGHLVEIYDFPSQLITRDLIVAFKDYKDRGFDIKWVDDNHAIGIFSSPIAAQAVLGMKHPLMKVRAISQASRQTKVKAKKCGSFMEPYRPRPETTAAVARSLVAGALGLKSNLTREQRDAERKKLKEAKEKRKQERQQKKDAWDGSYGKCAMDE